jgi:Flp pilus assembly protein TadG
MITKTNRLRRSRSGFALVYAMVCMVALLGFVSLAVDFGRAQVAKTELLRAADAAARYGVTGLSDGTAIAKATEAAHDNLVDGAPLVLANDAVATDVQLGNWDATQTTAKFSTTRTPVNAIRVTARRAAARRTAVPTMFATILGRTGCDVIASAIATKSAGGPNFIGLGSISAKNNTSAGYDPRLGAAGSGNTTGGAMLGSNGSVSFSQNASISGGVVLGPSGSTTVSTPAPAKLAQDLSFPSTENPPYIASGSLSVNGTTHITGGGTLVYTSITIANNSTLIFDRPTTVYVMSDIIFNNSGSIAPASGSPADLRIRIIGSPTSVVGGNGANNVSITAEIYAPDTDFSARNSGVLSGTALFRSMSASNTLSLYYDITNPGIGGTGGGGIAIVQ